ncbi:hypothetical protein LCGC14_3012350, partial [marine sediment metagenome]
RHINALAEETGVKGVPKGTKKGAPAHLLELILEAQAQRSGKSRPKPAKAKAAPKAKAAAPKAKPADPEVTTGGDEDVPPYSEWTKKELYDEAAEREIDGRSGMDKDELVAALEANDDED